MYKPNSSCHNAPLKYNKKKKEGGVVNRRKSPLESFSLEDAARGEILIKQSKKTKTIKAWAVFYKGKLATEGWGTLHSWIFRTKWLAQDTIKELAGSNGWAKEDIKVIPIKITLCQITKN